MAGTDIRAEPLIAAGPAGLKALVKRSLDVCLAVAATILLLPLMAVTAVAVAAAGTRPVLRRERRIGRYGRTFELLSFADPPGVLGGTGLGELPRLLNVIRGHLSLVGPRPAFAELEAPGLEAPRRRVRPGLVGPVQVRGSRDGLDESEAARLEDAYVAAWSLGEDARLLWRALRASVAAGE